jgi:hypothetical protein
MRNPSCRNNWKRKTAEVEMRRNFIPFGKNLKLDGGV